jgi:hypothetical protein
MTLLSKKKKRSFKVFACLGVRVRVRVRVCVALFVDGAENPPKNCKLPSSFIRFNAFIEAYVLTTCSAFH